VQIKALLERIERLERRVAELESKQTASPETPASAVAIPMPPPPSLSTTR
jgi:BMFP domain-containing protein YqiC